MATSTDVPIYTTTLSSAVPSVTIDLSAHQNYKNIKIVATPTVATSSANAVYRFNGDTGANYSYTQTYADGSSIVTNGPTNQTSINSGFTTTVQPVKIIYLMDYANSNTNKKTTLTRQSNASEVVQAIVGLWRSSSNAAITSVAFSLSDGGNFAIGSTFSVYGIGSATASTKATGGAIYSDANYMYHVFTSSGSFTPTQSLSADVLVVAGGGGGGSAAGGGGGAGGLLVQSGRSCSSGTAYTVTIGSGGAGGVSDGQSGSSGGNSVFDTITALGGGGGTHNVAGLNGGSGGGAGYGGSWGGGTATQGNSGGATGYGFAGGANNRTTSGSPYQSGSGGGAGAIGGAADNSGVLPGGIGRTDSFINAIGLATGAGETISGVTYFAGGGGGSYEGTTTNTAGYGGGGKGGTVISGNSTTAPKKGKINTGGGGGGGNSDGYYNGPSNNAGVPGGSGIVVVRYAK